MEESHSVDSARPTRLLCYCGKPLDKLDVQGQPAGQRGRQVTGGPPPRSSRYSAYVPGNDRTPRFTFRCRRCRASVTVRDLTLFYAHQRVQSEGRRDVVAGVDF